jgi:hypothetical protein
MRDIEHSWEDSRFSFELNHQRMLEDRLMDLSDRQHFFTPEAMRLPDLLDTPFPSLPPTPLVPDFPRDPEWSLGALDTPRPPIARLWGEDVSPRAIRERPRDAWNNGDPADSLYRRARELLNRGDWRRAAAAFREIPQKFPNSAYASDALYWQAFALYRIGGSAELRDALAALDVQRGKYPNAETQADASALATRIRGALAARGDAAAGAAVARTASEGQASCDQGSSPCASKR